MPVILDGKRLSEALQAKIAMAFSAYRGPKPILGILQVGNKEDSNIYVAHKLKVAESLGFLTKLVKMPENSTQDEIIGTLRNAAAEVTGIIVQLPLVSNRIENLQEILDNIPIEKDIDGLSSYNLASNYNCKDNFLSATPKGIILLLKHYNINFRSTVIALVGQSNIVGKPLAKYLSNFKNNTIKTYVKDTPKDDLHEAKIVIVATGVYQSVTADQLANGTVLIDVGIHRQGKTIHGDLDFASCFKKASYITPVPGGVGPLTVVALMFNLIKALILQNPNLDHEFLSLKEFINI
ncbi:methylenetetrahydrofolate dehydrogenase/methenyltetrahydrofolate cyclohydrolase [Metamycoplasma arthritidis]|uniref:Bifunctional protein FolD n=1 Tax=Metamycoplasma arthritidis (strain 158L3-1) TaxID=243272 RepID=FOLD_META1|nr:bifunctional 5,10-methylenetetrahydrofolate dehydrogenase/5,10-methenyltetrahydrofolate cyclohydrolase [Metamycoplasma arthritidis]B3PMJ8.1 RecName: Full=Bifunctional protein FolD; Includes: RecName: Full=Methylenetetrahydrofolate dehydrogenase; Includes: RecName: Full=Methenyltetrahydrofolate cyclohydrolase [Metamycoplasma arthritidis 158L3-1]ACF07250.1 methylenetetrahydrofolate dehydrogenase/methenyltetrahydrofolate cyclohydrolase [Metamycoplasma arthritidis 158L3-1]VEU78773.1 methylenetetr